MAEKFIYFTIVFLICIFIRIKFYSRPLESFEIFLFGIMLMVFLEVNTYFQKKLKRRFNNNGVAGICIDDKNQQNPKNTKNIIKIVVIAGPSGTGKSFLENSLLNNFPKVFTKMPQITTRQMRDDESQCHPYIFVDDETYNSLFPIMIGTLGVHEDSLFKEKYGTLPVTNYYKLNTVILAEEGLIDLYKSVLDGRLPSDTVIFTIGLDIDLDDKSKINLREGRDLNFITSERSVLKYADVVYKIEKDKFLNFEEVMLALEKAKFIKRI